MRSPRRRWPVLLPAAAGLAVFLLLFAYPFRIGLEGAPELSKVAHVLIFFCVAAGAAHAIRRRRTDIGLARTCLAAFCIATLLGALGEAVQMLTVRTASWWDMLRNMIGAAAGLLWYCSVAPGRGGAVHRRGVRRALRGAAALIVIGMAAPLALAVAAMSQRERAFPVLCDFEDWWARRFFRGSHSDVRIVPTPSAWSENHSRRAAKVVFQAGAQYPGIQFGPLSRDWRGYRELRIAFYSELPEAVTLTLRVHDARHDQRYDDRFNTTLTVVPGHNECIIALDAVMRAPATRPMAMDEVAGMALFAVDPKEDFALYVDELKLAK